MESETETIMNVTLQHGIVTVVGRIVITAPQLKILVNKLRSHIYVLKHFRVFINFAYTSLLTLSKQKFGKRKIPVKVFVLEMKLNVSRRHVKLKRVTNEAIILLLSRQIYTNI